MRSKHTFTSGESAEWVHSAVRSAFHSSHGTWSIATIEVALRIVHRLTIVNDCILQFTWQGKGTMLLLCNVLNLGVSKLSSYHCSNFICCTPCMGFAYVHNCMAIKEDMGFGVLQTIKVAIRNGKFMYCRLQIVNVHMHDKEKEQCLQLHFLMACILSDQYFKSQLHYLQPGYVIQLIVFQWDTPSSLDPSLLVKWVWLVRLHLPMVDVAYKWFHWGHTHPPVIPVSKVFGLNRLAGLEFPCSKEGQTHTRTRLSFLPWLNHAKYTATQHIGLLRYILLGSLVPRPLLDFSERGLGTRLTQNYTAKLVIISTQTMPYLVHPLELGISKPHGIADITASKG